MLIHAVSFGPDQKPEAMPIVQGRISAQSPSPSVAPRESARIDCASALGKQTCANVRWIRDYSRPR
jgi:hypothetical protein